MADSPRILIGVLLDRFCSIESIGSDAEGGAGE
jgi:hypothetical protein